MKEIVLCCKMIIGVEWSEARKIVTQFALVHKPKQRKAKQSRNIHRPRCKWKRNRSQSHKRFSSSACYKEWMENDSSRLSVAADDAYVGWDVCTWEVRRPSSTLSSVKQKPSEKLAPERRATSIEKLTFPAGYPASWLCVFSFCCFCPSREEEKNPKLLFFSHKLEFESSQITICRSPKTTQMSEVKRNESKFFYIAGIPTISPWRFHFKIRFVIYSLSWDLHSFRSAFFSNLSWEPMRNESHRSQIQI